jgi:hypothetical protein
MKAMFTQSRTPNAALQIAAQVHDDGVDHEAMNDDRAQGRCESHKQGTNYRGLARHHLARYCASRTIGDRVPSAMLGQHPRPVQAGTRGL